MGREGHLRWTRGCSQAPEQITEPGGSCYNAWHMNVWRQSGPGHHCPINFGKIDSVFSSGLQAVSHTLQWASFISKVSILPKSPKPVALPSYPDEPRLRSSMICIWRHKPFASFSFTLWSVCVLVLFHFVHRRNLYLSGAGVLKFRTMKKARK